MILGFRRTRGGGHGGEQGPDRERSAAVAPPGPALRGTGADLIERFGRTCPVCGAGLGQPTPWDRKFRGFASPPSFRLEIGPPDAENQSPWRVTTLYGNFPPATSVAPPFSENDVDYVYLLCGGGHIFPYATPMFHHDTMAEIDSRHRIDAWNMVAAIGAPASGKTYLLLRMLNQSLINVRDWRQANEADRIRRYQLSPLEEVPLNARANLYAQTLENGLPIPQTNMDIVGTPAGILQEHLPDALDAIRDVIRRSVLDGERRAENWGMGSRQPLVLRSEARGRRTWTGVADLPGELFALNSVTPRERVKLRAYDALVWVIDPVVAAQALDRLAEDGLRDDTSYTNILEASLRPGTTADVGHDRVRFNRDNIQIEIGQHLTRVDGLMTAPVGSSLQMLIAVTKCDVIHAALGKKSLGDLGDEGVVARGIAAYLAFLTRRYARQEFAADPQTGSLLDYLHGGDTASDQVREKRILQVANELLRHYSDQYAFWNLVHIGEADRLVIPADGQMTMYDWVLDVPSIGAHLDNALPAGSAYRMLLRDLVMSAVGCGVAYGLGHEDALYQLLGERWQFLRFFLCSPLGTVPKATGTTRLAPLEVSARFPRAGEQSAALTQLLLSVLAKARA